MQHLWLIPAFPFAGFLVNGLAGRRLPKSAVNLVAVGSVLLSFLWVLKVLFASMPLEAAHVERYYTWIESGILNVGFDLAVDRLTAVMLLVVTGVGLLIHIYSTGYMAHEGGYYRFFAYLNLFMFFMLVLVLGANFLMLFIGWEGVGLCSYLLIGFYFRKQSASNAANKAFIVNRIGDFGFLLGMLLIVVTFGTLDFGKVFEAAAARPAEAGVGTITLICLLLLLGATGKSAQIPLYVWLPDAMEGPTPVSALIHAATMVTAGVYMVARSNALFALTPDASMVVASVGAATAIFAASIGLVQNDIKRVLAYSTVSQLGYMFLAAGTGAYWVAIFHLYTHAFFKALLFLGSGSVIHAMSGEQDMRRMGGLKDKIPVTFRVMFIGSLAIAGIPGLAGFFSKDEILWQTWSSPLGSKMLYGVGLTTAAMTAFYMWRLMFMTFYGEPRMDEKTKNHIHESPAVMTVPLSILALGSVAAGWVGIPKVFGENGFFQAFEHWLEPVFEPAAKVAAMHGESHASHAVEVGLMALSVCIAIGGILLARHIYLALKPEQRPTGGAFYPVLLNKWYVDELYDILFVNGLSKGGGTVMAAFDSSTVDGAVNGTAWTTRMVSRISIWYDTWIVDGLVNLSAFFVRAASFPMRFLHTGWVQSYVLIFVAGVLAIFGFYWWGR